MTCLSEKLYLKMRIASKIIIYFIDPALLRIIQHGFILENRIFYISFVVFLEGIERLWVTLV